MEQSQSKKISLRLLIYFSLIIVILHFLGNSLGIYQAQIDSGFVWFDNVLHALTGALFGLLLLCILEKKNLLYSASKTSFLIIAFVLGLAAVWELTEFGFFKFFPTYAYELKIYSPSITEAFSDIISNAVGAIILLLYTKRGENL